MRKYILKEKKPVEIEDLLEWAKWFENVSNKIVKRTEIPFGNPNKKILISTVFLGIDHGFEYHVPHVPVLFETMVFGGPEQWDEYQSRYTNWDDAVIDHDAIVNAILAILEG